MHWICLAKPEQLRLSFSILWWWDKGGILCILCGKRIYMFFCFVLSTFTCHTSLDTAKISAFLLFNFRTAPLDFESRTAFLTSSGKEKKIKKKDVQTKVSKAFKWRSRSHHCFAFGLSPLWSANLLEGLSSVIFQRSFKMHSSFQNVLLLRESWISLVKKKSLD